MSRFTSIHQDALHSSNVYDDGIASGQAALETNQITAEDDFNGLRSQMLRLAGDANWYDALSGRDVATLSTDLTSTEEQIIVCNATVLTDVTVPNGQNWKLLVVASSEAPTEVAAVGVATEGAIVAQSALSGGGFDVAELILVAGPNALNPLNLVEVRNAADKQIPQSGGKDIQGLLQYESTGGDGDAFDDVSTGSRVKISFVRINAGGTALEACPVADIEDLVVEYNYFFNRQFQNLDRNCFVSSRGFVDQSASVDVTLSNAFTNQAGKANVPQNIEVQLQTGFRYEYEDAAGATVFQIQEGSAGGTTEVLLGTDVDQFDVDAIDVDFRSGTKHNTNGTRPIHVGINDGIIETTAGDFGLTAAVEFAFVDGNKAGSGFAGQLKLTETSAEWDTYETNFGEVSIFNALNQLSATNNVTKTSAVVTVNAAADVDVGGVAGGANLDAQIHDLSGGTFADDHDLYFNGQLLRGGANAAANFDYYPGTSLANGQIKFEFPVRGGTPVAKRDKITVVSRA